MNFNFIRQLDFKKKTLYQALIFIIVNAAIIYFIILPTREKIFTLKNLVLSQRIENNNQSEIQARSSSVNDKVKKAESMLDKFNNIFINKNREIEFITKLEEVASNNNILQKINLGSIAPIKEIGYTKSLLEINSQGSFENLYRYLIELETLNYYYSINSFEMSNITRLAQNNSNDPNQNSPIINLKLTGYTYWK